jgi:hypothetical protein
MLAADGGIGTNGCLNARRWPATFVVWMSRGQAIEPETMTRGR